MYIFTLCTTHISDFYTVFHSNLGLKRENIRDQIMGIQEKQKGRGTGTHPNTVRAVSDCFPKGLSAGMYFGNHLQLIYLRITLEILALNKMELLCYDLKASYCIFLNNTKK